MDPLSITASIVVVAGVAAKTGSAFNNLRKLCKTLPGRLHALSNEVTDIELVLYQVALLVKKREDELVLRNDDVDIQHQLNHARSKLEELRTIIEKLARLRQHTRFPIFETQAWRRDQPKLQALQEDIKNAKCSLNIILGVSNSYVAISPVFNLPLFFLCFVLICTP